MMSWSGESMPVHGPTWYSHWPGMTCRQKRSGTQEHFEHTARDTSEREHRNQMRAGRRVGCYLAVDARDVDARVHAALVVRLADCTAVGVLRADRAIVRALRALGVLHAVRAVGPTIGRHAVRLEEGVPGSGRAWEVMEGHGSQRVGVGTAGEDRRDGSPTRGRGRAGVGGGAAP